MHRKQIPSGCHGLSLTGDRKAKNMINPISIINRSGHTLRGILNLPDACLDGGKAPVVINLHGFGGNKCGYKNLHVQQSRALEANGIACVRFDFYGNGESDGEFSDVTFNSLLEDAEDVYNWVLEQEWAEKEQVILSGHSMGGYVASTIAPKLQPAKLILQAPGAAMWIGALERVLAMEEKGIFSADVEGLPFSTTFNKTMHPYEPFEKAKGYHGPVLLIKGSEDQMVYEEICQKYMDVYGENCTYVYVEGGNHNFASIPTRKVVEDAILKFVF